MFKRKKFRISEERYDYISRNEERGTIGKIIIATTIIFKLAPELKAFVHQWEFFSAIGLGLLLNFYSWWKLSKITKIEKRV